VRCKRKTVTTVLTTRSDSRSSARCHRRGIFLDSCQLPAGKCGLSTHHGSIGGHLWTPNYVLRIGGSLHHREHCLRDRANGTRHARRSNNSGCRWRRYTECELDNPVGPCTAATPIDVSELHTTGLLHRDVPCAHHRRSFDQVSMAMVSPLRSVSQVCFRY
jgi:hypothetical protein